LPLWQRGWSAIKLTLLLLLQREKAGMRGI
jgi:hypothetical protein